MADSKQDTKKEAETPIERTLKKFEASLDKKVKKEVKVSTAQLGQKTILRVEASEKAMKTIPHDFEGWPIIKLVK